MDILIRLIAFHCLSYTFHCYLTYDPDYFRDADRFSGWDSLCLDPPGFRIDFGCVCVRSRIPIPCLLMCDLRSARTPFSGIPRRIQSFRVLLVTRTQSSVPGAGRLTAWSVHS
jgi:hypothetical protein